MSKRVIPVIGFVAPSGTGKTTLLRKLVPVLREQGLRVGYLKHTHHDFDIDRPGKDSHAIAAAGAAQVMIASARGWALVTPHAAAADLRSLVDRFDADGIDLLLVEGFHRDRCPKIEVHRAATGKAPLYPDDDDIIAVVTDSPLPGDAPPALPISDPGAVAEFIVARLNDERFVGEDIRDALVRYSRRLRRGGFNDTETGNASVRLGDRFWITPSGAGADELEREDLIPCGLDGDIPEGASFDAPIHRAVYRARADAGAVLHSHGPFSVAVSFAGRDFVPADFEGGRLLGSVPVLSLDPEQHLEKGPTRIAEVLAEHPVCAVAGHGIYARGRDLKEAYRRTATLELSARIYVIAREAAAL
jgi:molybdopterin-guanine dinucleotide biosynthesis protein MobB